MNEKQVFTTDTFEQKVKAIADEMYANARHIQIAWNWQNQEARDEYWDYQCDVKTAIARICHNRRYAH